MPSGPDRRALDRSLVTGIAWTGAVKAILQVLSWTSTLVVARLLTPGDFGLFGMATVYLGLVALVNELGLGAAIIQRQDLDHDQVAALGGLTVLAGLALCLLSVILAGPVASLFGESTVRPLIQFLSLAFVTSALQVLPRSILARDLRFRALAALDLVEGLVLIAVTLAGALLGLKYWALALGSLASRLVVAAVGNLLIRHAYAMPRDFARMRDAVTFGWQVLVGRIAWYIYSNADFAIVGRVLGKESLGLYSIGWQLANIPVERITALVGRVMPGVFAAAQADDAALRRFVRGLTEGLALVTFPASAGLALVAPDFVHLVLGPRWVGAVLPLQLLSAYVILRSVNTVFPQILIAKGLPQRTMAFNIVAALLMPVAFLIGSRWGITGVATAWIVGYPVIAVPLFMRDAFRQIGMRWEEWIDAVQPAAVATAAMVVAILALHLTPLARWPIALRFSLDVTVAALAYFVTLWTLYGDRLREAVAFLGALRK